MRALLVPSASLRSGSSVNRKGKGMEPRCEGHSPIAPSRELGRPRTLTACLSAIGRWLNVQSLRKPRLFAHVRAAISCLAWQRLLSRPALVAILVVPLAVASSGSCISDVAGDLDPGFGTAGIVDVPPGDGTYLSILVQPDGKILAGGHTAPGLFFASVVRSNPDGHTLDQSFGNGGVATWDFEPDRPDSSGLVFTSFELLPDGKILAGGSTGAGFALARLNSDGTLDSHLSAAATASAHRNWEKGPSSTSRAQSGPLGARGRAGRAALRVPRWKSAGSRASLRTEISTPPSGQVASQLHASLRAISQPHWCVRTGASLPEAAQPASPTSSLPGTGRGGIVDTSFGGRRVRDYRLQPERCDRRAGGTAGRQDRRCRGKHQSR